MGCREMGPWGEDSCVLLSILQWEIGQPACQQVGVALVEENLMLQKREEGIGGVGFCVDGGEGPTPSGRSWSQEEVGDIYVSFCTNPI